LAFSEAFVFLAQRRLAQQQADIVAVDSDAAALTMFRVHCCTQRNIKIKSNLLKQQRAKSHLQVAKTMIKHATYAYYI